MRAMIFAAGLGTRLKPFTDHHPKALAIVNGESLLQRNILYLQAHGIYDVIVNVHHFADQIIEAVRNNNGWGSSITISDETNAVLETGGGLMKAQSYLAQDDFFVVINADILTNMPLGEMIKVHQMNKPLATLAVSNRSSSRCFLFDEHDELIGWKNRGTGELKGPIVGLFEKPYQEKAFSGIHVISSDIFRKNRFSGKFSMVDLYLDLCSSNIFKAFDHTGFALVDVGKPESIREAEKIFV
jgi:N-acetyl-alpha-D-muramate 1-phosphate uridylyltransferase